MDSSIVRQKLSVYKKQIEDYLACCFVYPEEPQEALFSAMRYSLLSGGKRLRPVFLMEFCRICGGEWKTALPFAAALEMIQTYSLIHDDLPCMDNDDFRRGKPTNHKVYGEAMAVLAGDGLLTAAFHELTKANLPAQRVVEAVAVLSCAAGETGMVGGQALDMAAEERECTKEEVFEIQSRKTGALIEAACCLGVICAGGTEAQLHAARRYAQRIGLAFQIRDDILDVIGDKCKLGKATGVDENKNTFVKLYGVARCEQMVKEETAQALQALTLFDDTAFLEELSRMLTERDS